MAEVKPDAAALAKQSDAVSLDAARDHVFTSLRSCERHAAHLKTLLDTLNAKQPGDEWLDVVEQESLQGTQFHEQQLQSWHTFKERMELYVAMLHRQADEWAQDELHAGSHPGTQVCAPASRTLHPELHRFKLEKQAKILGKYGGVPAMGAGLVMPRLPRPGDEGGILKATASPAAREIHYSKAENRDAAQLAQVMRFKSVRQEATPSPWQSEVKERQGRAQLGVADEAEVTSVALPQTPYTPELSGALQARQAALAAVEQAELDAAAERRRQQKAASVGAPSQELAEKLMRRTAAEASAAAAAAAARAAAEPPAAPTTTFSAVAPFGQELSRALQQRQQQQFPAVPAEASTSGGTNQASSSSSTPYRPASTRSGSSSMTPISAAAASNELAEKLKRRQMLAEAMES